MGDLGEPPFMETIKWPSLDLLESTEIERKGMQRNTMKQHCQFVAATISKFPDFLNFIKSVGCARETLPGKLAWCPSVPNMIYNLYQERWWVGVGFKKNKSRLMIELTKLPLGVTWKAKGRNPMTHQKPCSLVTAPKLIKLAERAC